MVVARNIKCIRKLIKTIKKQKSPKSKKSLGKQKQEKISLLFIIIKYGFTYIFLKSLYYRHYQFSVRPPPQEMKNAPLDHNP